MAHLAYRVRMILAREASFEAAHDEALVQFIESESDYGYYEWLHAGDGTVPIPVEVMEKVVKKATKLKLSADKVRRIQKDIAYARSRGQETIEYSIW